MSPTRHFQASTKGFVVLKVVQKIKECNIYRRGNLVDNSVPWFEAWQCTDYQQLICAHAQQIDFHSILISVSVMDDQPPSTETLGGMTLSVSLISHELHSNHMHDIVLLLLSHQLWMISHRQQKRWEE